MKTGNQRDWLVHDHKANSAIELLSHVFYLLLESLLLFFFFRRRYLFQTSFFILFRFLTLLLCLHFNLFYDLDNDDRRLSLLGIVFDYHKYEAYLL